MSQTILNEAPSPYESASWQLPAVEPTILVADDEEGIRDLIAVKLEMAGYHVVTADNGRTALDLIHSALPDIVILDISMPGIDGVSLCYQLHSSAATSAIPVLMVSSRDRKTDIDIGFSVGADDYLTKPFSPADLLRRVQALLR